MTIFSPFKFIFRSIQSIFCRYEQKQMKSEGKKEAFSSRFHENCRRRRRHSFAIDYTPVSVPALCYCGCCFIFGELSSAQALNKIVARAKQTSIAYLILTWKGRYSLKIYTCICDCAGRTVYEKRDKERETTRAIARLAIKNNMNRVCYCLLFAGLSATCDCVSIYIHIYLCTREWDIE